MTMAHKGPEKTRSPWPLAVLFEPDLKIKVIR